MNWLLLTAVLLSVCKAFSDENVETSYLGPVRMDVTENEFESSASAALTEEKLASQEDRALSSKKCEGDEKYFMIDITTDLYGYENSWRILKNTKDGPKEISSGPPANRKYGEKQRYLDFFCLSPGTYKFVIYDLYKDGMCCAYGQGGYAGYLENTEIFSSPKNNRDWKQEGHKFVITKDPKKDIPVGPKIGPVSGLSQRSQDWLDSHNSRRQEWHAWYGKSYVPLNWSNALMDASKIYAEKLAKTCSLKHDPNNKHGENLALNWGTGSSSGMRSTENVLSRFVEGEADDEYPANGHLTQVLWRATKYVGCAEASRPYNSGKCHVQVCRYYRPGNCNMSRYKSKSKSEWWLTPMLMDRSPCGEDCPPDGCID